MVLAFSSCMVGECWLDLTHKSFEYLRSLVEFHARRILMFPLKYGCVAACSPNAHWNRYILWTMNAITISDHRMSQWTIFTNCISHLALHIYDCNNHSFHFWQFFALLVFVACFIALVSQLSVKFHKYFMIPSKWFKTQLLKTRF